MCKCPEVGACPGSCSGKRGMVRGEVREEALAVGWVVQALIGPFTGPGSLTVMGGTGGWVRV